MFAWFAIGPWGMNCFSSVPFRKLAADLWEWILQIDFDHWNGLIELDSNYSNVKRCQKSAGFFDSKGLSINSWLLLEKVCFQLGMVVSCWKVSVKTPPCPNTFGCRKESCFWIITMLRKFNIDTKIGDLEHIFSFQIWLLWVSILNFRRAPLRPIF